MRRPRELAAAVAHATGVPRARERRRRLESLEDAVGENARLAALLEQQVRQLEAALVPMLEADQATDQATDQSTGRRR